MKCKKAIQINHKIIAVCEMEGEHAYHVFHLTDKQLDDIGRAIFLKSMGDRMFENLGRAMKAYVEVMKEAEGETETEQNRTCN